MELIIDIGSSKISIINKKNPTSIITEPCVVITKKDERNKYRPVIFGSEVYKALERGDYLYEDVVYPIVKEGDIVRTDIFSNFIEYFIDRIVYKTSKNKIKILALISPGLTSLERKKIEDLFNKLGYKNFYMLESTIAASKLVPEKLLFLVDIGADKTEISVIRERKIYSGCTVSIAGDMFAAALMDYLHKRYRHLINHYTAKEAILKLNSIDPKDTKIYSAVSSDGLSSIKQIEITASDLRYAILPFVHDLIDAIIGVYDTLSEDMKDVICENGIKLMGGISGIKGLSEYISSVADIDVFPVKDIFNTVVIGGSLLMDNKNELKSILKIEDI